jgi:hypothetical protein
MMKCDHMDHMVLSQNNVIILYKSQNDSLEVYPILRHTHIPLYIYIVSALHTIPHRTVAMASWNLMKIPNR